MIMEDPLCIKSANRVVDFVIFVFFKLIPTFGPVQLMEVRSLPLRKCINFYFLHPLSVLLGTGGIEVPY